MSDREFKNMQHLPLCDFSFVCSRMFLDDCEGHCDVSAFTLCFMNTLTYFHIKV